MEVAELAVSTLQDTYWDNGVLRGQVFFPAVGRMVNVVLDVERDYADAPYVDEVAEGLRFFIGYFSPKRYENLRKEVIVELNDNAYELNRKDSRTETYSLMGNDAYLSLITVLPKGFVLWYSTKGEEAEGAELVVQLTRDFTINDLSLYR